GSTMLSPDGVPAATPSVGLVASPEAGVPDGVSDGVPDGVSDGVPDGGVPSLATGLVAATGTVSSSSLAVGCLSAIRPSKSAIHNAAPPSTNGRRLVRQAILMRPRSSSASKARSRGWTSAAFGSHTRVGASGPAASRSGWQTAARALGGPDCEAGLTTVACCDSGGGVGSPTPAESGLETSLVCSASTLRAVASSFARSDTKLTITVPSCTTSSVPTGTGERALLAPTRVPLAEPRSSTVSARPFHLNWQCLRESDGSSSCQSLAVPRPTTI